MKLRPQLHAEQVAFLSPGRDAVARPKFRDASVILNSSETGVTFWSVFLVVVSNWLVWYFLAAKHRLN